MLVNKKCKIVNYVSLNARHREIYSVKYAIFISNNHKLSKDDISIVKSCHAAAGN